ncbi:hypothetical protein ACFWA9_19935 [Kitasatospora sp. NPDC059973]|uniref:hypothetical protein n=1 Tax=Kitasatospora sp. NPDC059973 TaxID=3347020 RepID=UPI0036CE309B
MAGAAAVVVVGGGAAAVAVHHDGERRDGHSATAAQGGGRHHGPEGRDGVRKDHRGAQGAPAPLPSLDAADAVVKATSGVAGGKAESLTAVTEQGGGRGWQAVVLGPDGVRHLVTVDGATGTVTGNAVLGG